MSFIKFESSRVKEEERQGIREAREKVLEKAKKEYLKRKENEIQAKLRGDDKWMLPSVESRLASESKKKKKHKKKSKHKKKKSKSRKHSSSSSSESESEEDEWVERESNPKKEKSAECSVITGAKSSAEIERDEWMNLPGMIPCISRQEIRQNKKKDEEANDQRNMLDKPGQSERELNPYWKDGGSGLPENMPKKNRRDITDSGGVGDKGLDWLRRALRRAQEQAEEEGRTLEDVAADRWGSLGKLKSMIEEAEHREKEIRGSRNFSQRTYNSTSPSARGNEHRDQRWRSRREEERGRPPSGSSRYPAHTQSLAKSAFRKPVEYDGMNVEEGSKELRKGDDSQTHFCSSSGSTSRRSENWRKKDLEKEAAHVVNMRSKRECKKKKSSSEGSSDSESDGGKEQAEAGSSKEGCLLTDQEMNELGAKLVKAEILGNEGLAKELKAKLERAREVRKKLVASAGEGMKKPEGGRGKEEAEELVVLTRTTSQGFARPVAPLREASEAVWGGKRRKKGAKVETHTDGKRVRYFADDDKYSLKEMFEREKLDTVEDSNEMFSKLVARGVGKPESVNDMDDVFEENARFMKPEQKEKEMERGRAIAEHHKVTKALEGCQWCLDSKLMLKHLIVAIGTKAFLCLPPHQSLTEGHCMIVPMGHMTCGTMVDEDVWTEIQEFRKTLTTMFLAMDQDCVFFETAINLKRFPHMVLECVPMAKETGDLAPIYFKKAIQECEMEWSSNKKVVDLAKKDVRRAIPKGLPYFCVDFGLQSGFAHVIEDERQWPHNFAQEIIGGMLDLDHHLWRKRRPENFENQRKKVLQFSKWWKDYDWTQKLKEKNVT